MVRVYWTIKWNGEKIGRSKDFVCIDGLKYFFRDDLNMEYLKENGHQTEDDKGPIKYYDIVVNGETYKNGAWYYTDYQTRARDFKNYVGFDEDVELSVG